MLNIYSIVDQVEINEIGEQIMHYLFEVYSESKVSLMTMTLVVDYRVTLFSSQEKANIFVPKYATDCVVVASKTGNLADLDTAAAAMALSTIGKEAALVAV